MYFFPIISKCFGYNLGWKTWYGKPRVENCQTNKHRTSNSIQPLSDHSMLISFTIGKINWKHAHVSVCIGTIWNLQCPWINVAGDFFLVFNHTLIWTDLREGSSRKIWTLKPPRWGIKKNADFSGVWGVSKLPKGHIAHNGQMQTFRRFGFSPTKVSPIFLKPLLNRLTDAALTSKWSSVLDLTKK